MPAAIITITANVLINLLFIIIHKRILRHEANFSPALRARYVKLRVIRSEQLPEAYFDRNLRPFLFIDEIYVY